MTGAGATGSSATGSATGSSATDGGAAEGGVTGASTSGGGATGSGAAGAGQRVPGGTAAAVITASNRSARGVRADISGQLVADRLAALGCQVAATVVVPDDVAAIQEALRAALSRGAAVVVTTGGTGLTPTDVTPEATRPLLDREIPGIAEAIRHVARDRVPTAVLSRGVAGTVGRALVVNLPGSPGGVKDGMAVLTPILGHLLSQLGGGDHVADPESAGPAPTGPDPTGFELEQFAGQETRQ